MVAHRGASARAPENTLPAFEAALEAGITVLECDARLSRDSQVVVIHDAGLERTTGARGLVRERRWSDLCRLDAGNAARFGTRFAGTSIPRLEDLLDLARGRGEVMVEIKAAEVGPALRGIEARCLEIAARTAMWDIGIISMSATAIRRIRQWNPAVPTALVVRRHDRYRTAARAIDAQADYLIAHVATLQAHPQAYVCARAAGLRLGAYPVNTEIEAAALVRAGVVALISDRPRRVAAYLSEVRA